ncbi:MAG TPA: ABC transporter ATP-binding protein [Clostridiaceae bacterium]|nr:ABC transporter ATP-binding protein [Clostridiaceae bacterium]
MTDSTVTSKQKEHKTRDYRKVFRGLVKYVKPEWPSFLIGLVLLLLANILALAGPRLSGEAVDAMGIDAGGVQFDAVLTKSLLMLAAYAGSAILNYMMVRLIARTSKRVIARMRQDTFDQIIDLPLSYIDTHQAGDLVSRISYDLDVVSTAISQDIIVIAASMITVVGSLVMMFRMSVALSMAFLALIPITVLFTIYRIKKTRPLFRKRSRKLGEMNGYVEEILFGQKTIGAYRKESFFTEEFCGINEEASDAHYRADYQAALNGPSVTLISNLSLALVAMIGVSLFLKGGFTIGILTSFILYSRRFSGPINEIAAIIAEMQSALSAAERVFTLLEQPPEPPDAKHALPLENVRGVVEFDRVSFAYTEDQPVIKDLSIKTKPGELLAIVGSTGAGKTTLINLLMRFYDPQEGEIRIDGKNLLDVTRDSLRRSFAMVLQDTWLFQGTIRDNIAYGKPEATLEEVRRAAEAAHIASYIESLPRGYDSLISDSASNLSQGQKQLMTIARAMLLDTPMLILDEATSNVDSQTEIVIQDAMNKLVQGRTSFVIAHRLSTVRNADQIVLLRDGQVVEQGTHDELLARGEAYADLYQAQFS